jgi:hydroxymethylpyrimidine/phosphomethylpyrimidine kinase
VTTAPQSIVAPVLLVAVGGFDPGGGAGVVRDFLTARTLGARPHLVPTAWTLQSPAGVAAIEPVAPAELARALRAALDVAADRASLGTATAGAAPAAEAGGGAAVKVGMLPDGGAAEVVRQALERFSGPVVLDPVLAASSGGALYRGSAAPLLALAARATVVTPNAGEAAALTGLPVRSAEDGIAAAQALVRAGMKAVLLKGGHLRAPSDGQPHEVTDLLVTSSGVERLTGLRVPGRDVRGTGCALATALAVWLARGLPLREAAAASKAWLGARLGQAIDAGPERHLP